MSDIEEIRRKDFSYKHCQAGCKVFSFGEIKHHKDCLYYEDSLSSLFDYQAKEIDRWESELNLQIGWLDEEKKKTKKLTKEIEGLNNKVDGLNDEINSLENYSCDCKDIDCMNDLEIATQLRQRLGIKEELTLMQFEELKQLLTKK